MATMTSNKDVAIDAIRKAGFPASQQDMALRIAAAESGLNPRAVNNANKNGTSDYGLFQINSIHKPTAQEKTDPYANAKRAYRIFQEAGNSWRPWATYNSGAYKSSSVASILGSGGGTPVPGGAGEALGGMVGDAAVGAVGDSVRAAVQSVLDKVAEFLEIAYMILIGVILIIVGVVILNRGKLQNFAISTATKGVLGKKGIASKVIKGVTK